MRSTRTRSRVIRRLSLAAAILALAPSLVAWHWARAGWCDWHLNYPGVPSGYTQIVNRFGEPCNSNATSNWMQWEEADTDNWVTVRFHRKLGGYPTEMVSNKGGRSTNLDNDVYGHVNNVVYYSFFDTAVNTYLIERGALDIHDGRLIGLVVETHCNFFAPLQYPNTVEAGIRVGRVGTSSVRYEIGLFADAAATSAASGHFATTRTRRCGTASPATSGCRRRSRCPTTSRAGPRSPRPRRR